MQFANFSFFKNSTFHFAIERSSEWKGYLIKNSHSVNISLNGKWNTKEFSRLNVHINILFLETYHDYPIFVGKPNNSHTIQQFVLIIYQWLTELVVLYVDPEDVELGVE